MPATEQTWYNLKRLHKAFALSSISLLLATLLLFAVDHGREWKAIQRTSDRIEARVAGWQRLQQLTDDVRAERRRLIAALTEIEAEMMSADVLQQFCAELNAYAARRGVEPVDVTPLEVRLQKLEQAVQEADAANTQWQAARLAADKAELEADDAAAVSKDAAGSDAPSFQRTTQEARKGAAESAREVERACQRKDTAQAAVEPLRAAVLDWLNDVIQSARFREDESLRQRKFALADLDAAKADRDLAVRKEYPQAKMEPLWDAVRRAQREARETGAQYEAASAHRLRLQDLVNRLSSEGEVIRKRLAANDAELRRLDQLLMEKRSTYFTFKGILPVPGKRWLELPILDAFNSPRKIDNVWSDALDQQLGSFGRVRRFDRCTTCHAAIDKVDPADPRRVAYPGEQTVDLFVTWPRRPPEGWEQLVAGDAAIHEQLDKLLGIQFAEEGLLNEQDVTVRFVRAASLASMATTSLPDDTPVQARLCANGGCRLLQPPRLPPRQPKECWSVTCSRPWPGNRWGAAGRDPGKWRSASWTPRFPIGKPRRTGKTPSLCCP